MKHFVALCLLSAAPLFAAPNGRMSDMERAFLVDKLEQTKSNMLESIAGLTPAQWRFKASPDSWSVAECAEHIILSEDLLFGGSQKMLQSPTVARPEKSNADVDQKIFAGVTDRSKKAKAPEQLVPSGRFATPADAARAFTERRDKSIAYAKSTEDELRTHAGDSPAGLIDAYQFLLLMAAHSARHTAQIREVEANANYSKASAGVRMPIAQDAGNLVACRSQFVSMANRSLTVAALFGLLIVTNVFPATGH